MRGREREERDRQGERRRGRTRETERKGEEKRGRESDRESLYLHMLNLSQEQYQTKYMSA